MVPTHTPNTMHELDSHVDTCTFSNDIVMFCILHRKGICDKIHHNMALIENVYIATGTVAYDCLYTHQTFLNFHQTTLPKSLEHHLINPKQVREFGVTINNIPLLQISPKQGNHFQDSIIDLQFCLHILMKCDKLFSYFTFSKPSQKRLKSGKLL